MASGANDRVAIVLENLGNSWNWENKFPVPRTFLNLVCGYGKNFLSKNYKNKFFVKIFLV